MGTKVLALIGVLATAGLGFANDTYRAVCRVEVLWWNDQQGKEDKTEQTGFMVLDEQGIYTALHGVCRPAAERGKTKYPQVTAIFPPKEAEKDGPKVIIKVKITRVDIARDIAFLEPDGGQPRLPEAGLPFGRKKPLNDFAGAKVKVVGHGNGIEFQRDVPLVVRERASDTLGKIINPKAREVLSRRVIDPKTYRTSPDLDSHFLAIEGNLVPGHSGAPILASNGTVVGVGIGGLKDGTVGYGWATPFYDIQLRTGTDPAVREQLDRLAKHAPSSECFAILDDRARSDPAPLVVSQSGEKLERELKQRAQQDYVATFNIPNALGVSINYEGPQQKNVFVYARTPSGIVKLQCETSHGIEWSVGTTGKDFGLTFFDKEHRQTLTTTRVTVVGGKLKFDGQLLQFIDIPFPQDSPPTYKITK